eukprot:TRINITY_DN1428_c0_g1_i2.p1 TRINITY_DN1428_c0_g1~~TRINITY_DN1428_c0_g1_i2.p1  ORF type:complete len:201 (-),score=78.22 TRINITY_DN1428_c0_g1_i2:868-1470(-)
MPPGATRRHPKTIMNCNCLEELMNLDNKTLLMYLSPLLLIGVIKLLAFVWGILGFIYQYFLKGGNDPRTYGKWAVVTGATDGIGRAYCNELASKKMNIYLISRTQSKLEEAAKEIAAKYNVETKYLAVDYSVAEDAEYAMIAEELDALDVGVLINNVGASHAWPERLDQMEDGMAQFLIEMNVQTTTRMCEIMLPQMKKR